jgi:carbon storage regulator
LVSGLHGPPDKPVISDSLGNRLRRVFRLYCCVESEAKGELHMLILTRRPGETLIIELPNGKQIDVTVLEVKGNQVRLGTDAPDDIAIVRKELLERLEN